MTAKRMTQMLTKLRYPLLAGTILSTFALPQWGIALDARSGQERNADRIILAQKVDPNDPKQKAKQKQQQQQQQKQRPQQQQRPQPPQTRQAPPQQRPGQPQQQQRPPQQRPVQQQPPKQLQPKQQPAQQQQPKQLQPKQRPAQQQQKQLQPKQQPAQQQPKQLQPKQQPAQPKQLQPKQQPAQQQPKQQPAEQQQKQLQPKQQPAQQQGLPPQQRQFGKQPPQGQQPGQQPRQFGKQPPQGQQPTQQGQQPIQRPLQQPAQQGQQPTQQGRPAQQAIRPQPAFRQGLPGQPARVDQLRGQRRERTEAGGRVVIEEPGRRFIVRDGNRVIIRQDEAERFRRWGNPRFETRGQERFAVVRRSGGVDIITVTDVNGRFLRRVRRGPDGREVILIDNRPRIPGAVIVGAGIVGAVALLTLAPPVVTIPRERYIVGVYDAPPAMLYETLEAPPVEPLERAYSLDEIRNNAPVRDRMRRVDIDTINFATGSWEVSPDQAEALAPIAEAITRVISENPEAVFMIEGHTDAVGEDVDNLSLSDRRAESVANVLTEVYQIPPENLVTQGYGEQQLKVPTEGPNRENRRVTIRNITPLLKGGTG